MEGSALRACDALVCRHGFWGIFLLAAWPNALFDLCGICCGHFLMPFWEFIGATMAGKALVKASLPLPYSSQTMQAAENDILLGKA